MSRRRLLTINGLEFYTPEREAAPPEVRVTGFGRVGTAWNRYGWKIEDIAKEFEIPLENLLAVIAIESAGWAFVNELVVIRFEPHVFRRRSGVHIKARRARGLKEGQRVEWDNLTRAAEANEKEAFMSTSFGLGQIMGFNHEIVGYESPQEMALAFQLTCSKQIKAIADFIRHSSTLLLAAQTNDWSKFARYYNGPGNVDYYSQKLHGAWLQARQLKERVK